jgi:hypothetical protein
MIVRDYLSLWEVVHRWHGFDPNKTNASDRRWPFKMRFAIYVGQC